jgi:hypothetical protein
MEERRSQSTRSRQLPWRAALVALALVGGWLLPPSAGTAQTGGSAQPRVCRSLQAALDRVGGRRSGAAAQAIAARLQRLGCATTGPTSTVGSTPTTIAATTTSVHQDCQLPGGGVGPCPSTTVGTGNPGTTTTIPFPPTSLPGGGSTVPSPSTTLPPCTTTTTGQAIPTTVPCVP